MKILAHITPFYGNPKPGTKPTPGVNYKSNDLRVIRTQLELIQRAQYDGVIVLWYVDVDPFINDACEKICFLCEEKQMLFGLCVDPWAMGKDKTAMTIEQKNEKWTVLLGLAQNFMNSRAYLPEKYIIDFATGADIPAVVKQNMEGPYTYNILRTYYEVAWPQVKPGLDSKAKLLEMNKTAIIPCVMHSFDDHDPANPTQSIWGGPARRIDSQDGMLELDLVKGIRALPKEPQYVQRISYNDYRERHFVERQMIADALRLGYDVSALL